VATHIHKSPEFSALGPLYLSSNLQKASLADIARIMEVQDMELWSRIVKYLPVVKSLQAMAWMSPAPAAASRWISKFAPMAAIAVVSATSVNVAHAGGPCTTAPCFQGLGDLAGGTFQSGARGVSVDGSTVVGMSRSTQNGVNDEAFRWTAATGMIGLGDLPGGAALSYTGGVSADGSRVPVSSGSGNANCLDDLEAGLWSQSGGLVGIGDLPGGCFYSIGIDISADGTIIVGASADAANNFRAARRGRRRGRNGNHHRRLRRRRATGLVHHGPGRYTWPD
jgi:hypothetical protein